MGVDTSSPETIRMLCEWSDVILLAEPQMKKKIPTKLQGKIDERFTIGIDNFPVSISGVLTKIVAKKLKDLNYI